MLKATREIVCPYLTDCINSATYDCKFPNELREAGLSPLFKNDDPNYKGNFRPISVLPAASIVEIGTSFGKRSLMINLRASTTTKNIIFH